MSETNPNDPLMPFGKHKGTKVSDLTPRYCRWLVDNVKLYGPVERAVKARLGMPIIEQLTEEERIDRAVQTTVERLLEQAEEVDP